MPTFNLSEIRKQIDSDTKKRGEVDDTIDPMHLAMVARDAYDSCNKEMHREILASIPPIKLGKTLYRVVGGGRYGLDIVGPRGGYSVLVQNLKDPTAWAHNTGVNKTTWYRRGPNFTFTRI